MTWVVYALLALNLGLLAWNLQTGATGGAATMSGSVIVDDGEAVQLPLLAELSGKTLRLRATAPMLAAQSETANTTQTPAAPPSVADQAIANVAQPASTVEGRDAPDATASRDSSPVAPAAPSVAMAAAMGEESSALPAVKNPESACLTLGPLEADAPAEKIRVWLEGEGAQAEVRNDERREMTLYWVYFPPRSSREQAVADVERLRSEGLTDVIAVRKGDMANAISLGVFSRSDSRDRRVKEMSERGYQPSVAPRYRTRLATWIDVSAPDDTLSDAQIRSRWPALRVSRKPCSGEPVPAVQIAVEQGASYNSPTSGPRRFHFSGMNAQQSVDASSGETR